MLPGTIFQAIARIRDRTFLQDCVGRLSGSAVVVHGLKSFGTSFNNKTVSEDTLGEVSRGQPWKLKRWGYYTPPHQPLLFNNVEASNSRRVDVEIASAAEYGWQADTVHKTSYKRRPVEFQRGNTAITVYALDKQLLFRKDIDAEQLEDLVDKRAVWRRAWFRIHYDFDSLSTPRLKQKHVPRIHLQVGGKNPKADPYDWVSDEIKEPRLFCLPLDIFQAIEAVVANFCPDSFDSVTKDAVWIRYVPALQRAFLKSVLTHANEYVDNEEATSWYSHWCEGYKPLLLEPI